ncbi:hypothetical protein B0H13DRAFT_2310342 [Mycena leptocephala]|nr:hypothetical protein B0H13DRAFT_2310342 [Mycena leptocephala]
MSPRFPHLRADRYEQQKGSTSKCQRAHTPTRTRHEHRDPARNVDPATSPRTTPMRRLAPAAEGQHLERQHVLDRDAAQAPHLPHTQSIKQERKGRSDAPCACCAPPSSPSTPIETSGPNSAFAPARWPRRPIPCEIRLPPATNVVYKEDRILPAVYACGDVIRPCSYSVHLVSSQRRPPSQLVDHQAHTSTLLGACSSRCSLPTLIPPHRKNKEGTHLTLKFPIPH